MKLFRRWRSRTFTFRNDRPTELLVWLEPWAEEFSVVSGSRVDLIVEGLFAKLGEADFDFSESHLVFFAPGGARVRVLIDGRQCPSSSSEIAAPKSGKLTTRQFTSLVFEQFPEARFAGAPTVSDIAHEKLAAPMADGEIRLEPLAEAHRAALKAACAEDLDIWPIYAISYDPDHFDASFDALLARPNGCGFAIFSGEALVGMSCYLGVDAARGVLEIGNTYYVPAVRGTGFNRRVKDLMIGRAIGCGFRRIEFRVDARNARSQAAMAKLGAVREGVIRAERITWTGHVRDTVLFSILAREWKAGGG